MKSELMNKGRREYINLNKEFLRLVEDGASWEELQPLFEKMKSLAVYLHQIPDAIELLDIPVQNNTAQQAAGLQEDPV